MSKVRETIKHRVEALEEELVEDRVRRHPITLRLGDVNRAILAEAAARMRVTPTAAATELLISALADAWDELGMKVEDLRKHGFPPDSGQ